MRNAPEGYTLLKSGEGFEIFADGLFAMGFSGKRTKRDWHYRFKTEAQRDTYVAKYCFDLEERAKKKLEDKAAKASWQHGLNVGDLFYSSWGYDQTNIDFYEVTEVRGKSVIVVELAQNKERTYLDGGTCTPKKGMSIGEPRRMIPQPGYEGKPYLAVRSFTNAYPYTGRVMNWSDGA